MRCNFLRTTITTSLIIFIIFGTIGESMITCAKIEELPEDKVEEYTKFLLGLLEEVLGIDISKYNITKRIGRISSVSKHPHVSISLASGNSSIITADVLDGVPYNPKCLIIHVGRRGYLYLKEDSVLRNITNPEELYETLLALLKRYREYTGRNTTVLNEFIKNLKTVISKIDLTKEEQVIYLGKIAVRVLKSTSDVTYLFLHVGPRLPQAPDVMCKVFCMGIPLEIPKFMPINSSQEILLFISDEGELKIYDGPIIDKNICVQKTIEMTREYLIRTFNITNPDKMFKRVDVWLGSTIVNGTIYPIWCASVWFKEKLGGHIVSYIARFLANNGTIILAGSQGIMDNQNEVIPDSLLSIIILVVIIATTATLVIIRKRRKARKL